jgi:hypothetical protein
VARCFEISQKSRSKRLRCWCRRILWDGVEWGGVGWSGVLVSRKLSCSSNFLYPAYSLYSISTTCFTHGDDWRVSERYNHRPAICFCLSQLAPLLITVGFSNTVEVWAIGTLLSIIGSFTTELCDVVAATAALYSEGTYFDCTRNMFIAIQALHIRNPWTPSSGRTVL